MKIYNNRYKVIAEIGEGAYGKIHLAEDLKFKTSDLDMQVEYESEESKITDKFIAIKKMKIDENTGIDFTSIRELKILQEIQHENIIKLNNVFVEEGSLFMGLEYMVCDLSKLIDDSDITLNNSDIKFIFRQIVQGVNHLHENWILHRDLKPGNILVDINGKMKITDFGLARYHGDLDRKLTKGVVTRWYRAPEILLGANYYGESVDVWSLGCIFAELYLRTILFRGESDIDQLSKIYGIRGTPDDDSWPNVDELPLKFNFEKRGSISFKRIIPNVSDEAVDLIEKMLCLNPSQRISCKGILEHPFLKINPLEEEKHPEFIKQLQKYKHPEIH